MLHSNPERRTPRPRDRRVRSGADVENRIADALSFAVGDLFVAQHTEAKRIHERIALVAFVKINLTRDGRDAKAIAVMRDARHDAREEPAVICDLGFAIGDFPVSVFSDGWLALTPARSPRELVITDRRRCRIRSTLPHLR